MIAHQSSQTNACCNKTRSIDRCMWCGYNHKMHDCWLHHQFRHHQFRMGTEFCGRQLEEKLPRKDEQSRCALALRGDEPPASEAAFNWKRWAPKPKPHLICASCWELTGCYSLWLGGGFSGCIILGLLDTRTPLGGLGFFFSFFEGGSVGIGVFSWGFWMAQIPELPWGQIYGIFLF